MPQTDLFLIFTERLETATIPYMVSGSVASIIYGEPRLTNDIDIILHIGSSDVGQITQAFPLTDFYCPPEEVMAIEARRKQRGHFNLIHHDTGHKADIYLYGKDPLHAWGFANRRRIELGQEQSLWVAPPEYVILRKLQYFKEGGSEKHVGDIRGMLEVSGDAIDSDVLDHWIPQLGLTAEWADIAEGTTYWPRLRSPE
ncbi:MAG: hypothetical protein HQ559_18390 [Lentisphaerae bacterium]|nr:hypothetical protein [Lentisphaerota bacterium]